MNATLTNALTNALYAFSLFIYLIIAAFQRIRGNEKFPAFIVIFFLTIFILEIMGVWVHYAYKDPHINQVWIGISLGVVFLNYCLIYAIKITSTVRILALFISLVFTYFFITQNNFLFIALSVIFTYLLAARYSRGLSRLGFLCVVASNIIWILLREVENALLGHEVPVQYRYDNDVYHILLIVSTYIIFLAISRGDWSYPGVEK